MKKICLLVMSIFMAVLCCGCSDLSYSILLDYDGTIQEKYSFVLDSRLFDDKAVDVYNEVNIKLAVIQNLEINDFNKKVNNSVLDARTKLNYKNGFHCEFIKPTFGETMTYNFIFKYDNMNIYDFAYDIDRSKPAEYEYKYHFLTYDIVQKSRTKFGVPVKLEDNSIVPFGKYLWDSAFEVVKGVAGETVANSLEKPNFVYNYITTSSRLHSSCDDYYRNGVYYIHSFKTTYENLDKEIYFYQTEARREIWYAIILGITLVSVGVVFLVNYLIDKKKKSKTQPDVNNEQIKE